MLSIDEAIAHAREVASEQKRRSGICVQNNSECDKFSACLKCAEEHEQLADWLEELKAYRENVTVEENKNRIAQLVDTVVKKMIEAFENLEIEDVNMFQLGYNKAIDDFAGRLIRYVDCGHLCSPTEMRWSDLTVVEMVKKLAEQLKSGD